MLKIDTDKIGAETKKLYKHIEEYSNNCDDIFHEISNVSSYWKDDETASFEEKMLKQKKSSLSIIELLEDIGAFYKNVEETYNKKEK